MNTFLFWVDRFGFYGCKLLFLCFFAMFFGFWPALVYESLGLSQLLFGRIPNQEFLHQAEAFVCGGIAFRLALWLVHGMGLKTPRTRAEWDYMHPPMFVPPRHNATILKFPLHR